VAGLRQLVGINARSSRALQAYDGLQRGKAVFVGQYDARLPGHFMYGFDVRHVHVVVDVGMVGGKMSGAKGFLPDYPFWRDFFKVIAQPAFQFRNSLYHISIYFKHI
jgi:hypothetical protein